MTAKKLKPYPKYKDSGVSWIGMVPLGWEVVRFKYIFKERIDKGHPDETMLTATQNHGVISKEQYENRTVVAQKDLHLLKLVRIGDFVISLRSFQGGIEYAYTQGIISPAYTIIYTKCISNKYFRILGKSKPFIQLLQSCVTGIREGQNIDYQKLKNEFIPLPPRPEQDAIVAYLDDKTAKIDRLIGLYKREIELLKERRQAVIHQAVTRGLDDKVKLKDSGVSWIGMVPQGWEVSSVGRLYSAFLGKMLEQSSNFSQPNSEYKPYICAKDVHFDGVDITDSKLMKFNKQEIQKYSVKRGDLLIVEGGAGAGGSAIYNYDDERMVQNSIHVVRSRGFLLNRYLYYWMYSLVSRDYIDAVCNKATIPHFTGEKLTATMIPLPPRSEQDDIVAYLDDQCAKVDAMIGKVQSKIGLLEEYRVRLISDVVTGKVRV